MTSQLDLDQGGLARTWNKIWLGPSIGLTWVPSISALPIVAAGSYALDPSINYVTVNAVGVTIILPTVKASASGAITLPGLSATIPVVITDLSGNAQSNPITIKPNNPGETIMGLAQVQITANYGALTLAPNSTALTWSSVSP